MKSQVQPGQASLNDEERDSLWSMVTDEEIKAGLWSMKANKAPGPDGLYAGFFQLFWPIVQDLVGHSESDPHCAYSKNSRA